MNNGSSSNSWAEVTNISQHGFWIVFQGEEYLVPFAQFPWFHDAPVRSIHKLTATASGNLHWPDLDVDLSVTILRNPEHFRLVSAG